MKYIYIFILLKLLFDMFYLSKLLLIVDTKTVTTNTASAPTPDVTPNILI